MLGYHSQIILAGRRINDDMGKYVAENAVKSLIKANKPVKGARVAIIGFTFKENCPDTRNTKIFDIVTELREYGIEPVITDPIADKDEAKRLYGVDFVFTGYAFPVAVYTCYLPSVPGFAYNVLYVQESLGIAVELTGCLHDAACLDCDADLCVGQEICHSLVCAGD